MLSIANFAISATNFSLANFFKTFRQFGETLLMVLIASIRRHSMSDTRAVVFHNSYATETDKLRITKMITRSRQCCHIRQSTHTESLSFAMHDDGHTINKYSFGSFRVWHTTSVAQVLPSSWANRSTWPSLIF